MYFQLTEAMKRRFILELRKYWQYHPRYPDLVDHIQGKYSFKERPSAGIIVKTGGGNRVDLSADNYIGMIESYVYMTKVKDCNGVAIEWVREDAVAIQNNGGRFPSAPGVYFVDLVEDEQFFVDPLYDVYAEIVSLPTTDTAITAQPFLEGTLRLFEMPAAYKLHEGTNYNVVKDGSGKPTGELELLQPVENGRWLTADYRFPGESVGPYPLTPGHANNTAIPGVVLAFGRRNQKGDRIAVVVQDIRRPAALEYGGRWEMTLDFDVVARDVYAQQEIYDASIIYLWGVLRPYLSSEGLEMTDISMGGESEEVYDENGDDYFYNAAFSLTITTDWSIHVPLGIFLRSAAPLTVAQAKSFSAMTDEEIAKQKNNIQDLEALGLDTLVDPFFSGKVSTFETIK